MSSRPLSQAHQGKATNNRFFFCRISLQQQLVPHVIDSKWDVSACKGACVSEEKQSARRAFAVVELEDFLVVFWDVLVSQ